MYTQEIFTQKKIVGFGQKIPCVQGILAKANVQGTLAKAKVKAARGGVGGLFRAQPPKLCLDRACVHEDKRQKDKRQKSKSKQPGEE